MPVATMQHQCETGLRWLREGRIDGIIIYGTAMDLSWESVEWGAQVDPAGRGQDSVDRAALDGGRPTLARLRLRRLDHDDRGQRPSTLQTRRRDTPVEGQQWFRKVGTRAAQAISKVVMAAVREPHPRIDLGSVAPAVVRLPRTEATLAAGVTLAEAQAVRWTKGWDPGPRPYSRTT